MALQLDVNDRQIKYWQSWFEKRLALPSQLVAS
jgi:hypothetical protein